MNRKQKSTGNVQWFVISKIFEMYCIVHNFVNNIYLNYSSIVKEAWNNKKTSARNLREMGLVSDPNKTIKIPNFKQTQIQRAKQMVNQIDSDEEVETVVRLPPKKEVAEKLEKQAKAPRKRMFM